MCALTIENNNTIHNERRGESGREPRGNAEGPAAARVPRVLGDPWGGEECLLVK